MRLTIHHVYTASRKLRKPASSRRITCLVAKRRSGMSLPCVDVVLLIDRPEEKDSSQVSLGTNQAGKGGSLSEPVSYESAEA